MFFTLKIRGIVYHAIIATIVLFYILQLFFKTFSGEIFFISFLLLTAIIVRRTLLTQKDITLQQDLKETTLQQAEKEEHFELKTLRSFGATIKNIGIKAKKSIVNEAKVAYGKADIALRAGKTLEAKKILIQVLSLDPNHLEANNKLGLLYLKEGEPTKAEVIFRKITKIKKHGEYFFNLALSLMDQGQYEEAIKEACEAIKLSSKNAKYYELIAKAYIKTGNKEEACRYFFQASERDPKNPEYLSVLIDYHQEKGDLKDNANLLRKMLLIYPHDAEIKESLRAINQR